MIKSKGWGAGQGAGGPPTRTNQKKSVRYEWLWLLAEGSRRVRGRWVMKTISALVLAVAGWIGGAQVMGEAPVHGVDSLTEEWLAAYAAFLERNPEMDAAGDFQLLNRGMVHVHLRITDQKPASGSGYFRTVDGQTLDIFIWHLGNRRAGNGEQWLSREGKLAHEFHHAVQFLRGEIGFLNVTGAWVLYAYDVYDEYDAYRVQYEAVRAYDSGHRDLAHGILRCFSGGVPEAGVVRELSKDHLYGNERGIVLDRRAITQAIHGLPKGSLYQTRRWFFYTHDDGVSAGAELGGAVATPIQARAGRE